jgi:hypothetical protein
MAKNISNIFFFFNILLLLTFFITKCQNEIPTQTVEEKDQIKDVKKTEEEKKQLEVFSLMKDFNNEWENKMVNYNSDYDYTIPLRPRIQEIYYENVTTVPAIFKGAFIISDETTDKIEFIIKDPNNKNIYQVTKHHDVFEVPIRLVGKYTIIFNNRISKTNLMVTFTMNNGQNNPLNAKDLTKTEQKLEALNTVIKKFNLEFKFGHDIHTKRYKSKFYI